MEVLEAAVSKELNGMFERGAFDSIGRLLSTAIANSSPAPSRALHLTFGLSLLDIRVAGKSERRIRALGHLFVVSGKKEGSSSPEISFGISPAFVDDVKPCPACVGTGVSWEDAKTTKNPSPRPFAMAYRKID